MELDKLNPWNWFKHEEVNKGEGPVPVKREDHPVSRGHSGFPGDIWQLHREMDRLFDETFKGLGWPSFSKAGRERGGSLAFTPKLDVASAEKEYTITLEAPGLEEKDIQLDLQDHTLFIRGEKRQENEEKDKHFYRIERSFGQFQRVLELPQDVDTEAIQAKMNKGVLTLSLPRKEADGQPQPRKIEIQS
ncbi:Hsp20/alpha crystallin family protein [Marinospirillum sp.]|uniref:Hsp20/alpha crystallin family protein n=1 Tax=Marinospirillum sp. TaxID=2183934 RepID=UPI00384FB694